MPLWIVYVLAVHMPLFFQCKTFLIALIFNMNIKCPIHSVQHIVKPLAGLSSFSLKTEK